MMGAIHSASRRRSVVAEANSPLHNYDWSSGSATGSETVTRSGTATYINSSGNRVSAAANTARVDYSGESPNTVLGLLVEPASSNVVVQSSNLQTGWGQTTLTFAAAAGTGMGGTNTLYSFTQTGTGSQFSRTCAVPSSSMITATWYLKAGTGRWVTLTMHNDPTYSTSANVFFDLLNGVPGTSFIGGTAGIFTNLTFSARKLGNGIVECVMKAQANSTVTSILLQCNMANGDNTYEGGTSGHVRYFDSVQVETSGLSTSFIPTTTAAVSRGADTVTIPMTSRTYDILVMDTAGGEWRNGVVVSGGAYTVTPKTGKRHVLKVTAYPNGVLSTAEKEVLSAPPPYPYTSGMTLVWNDEFTDTNVARISDSGTVTSGGGGKTWRSRFSHGGGGFSSATINNESQVYTNSGTGGYLGLNPFTISDSTLKIKAAVIPNGTANVPTNTFYQPDAPYKFYSGMISSDPNKRFIYGVFEIRSRSDAINGTWPAFWLIRDPDNINAGGEIDIFENIGNQPTVTHQTWHSHIPNNHIAFGGPYTYPNGGTINQWHTYAVKWEPGRVRWYVDGIQTREVLRTELDGYEMMLIANLALNTSLWQVSTAQAAIDDQTGVWDPNPANLPTYLEIDYIRVYQTSEAPVESSEGGPAAPTAWTAATGAQTGEVFVNVTDLPDPGDGAVIGDTLGEITSVDVEVNGGSWIGLQPVRMTDLPLWVCIDLNKPNTVWADTAGTTPAAHGSVVARIDDARGTGAFYLTGGAPVYQIVDGRRFLLSAAVDLINLPLDLVRNRSAVSVIAAFRSTSTAGNLLRTTIQGSTSTLWLRTRVNSGVCNAGGRRLFADTLASNDIVGQDVVNDDVVFTSIFNLATANLKCRLNKTQYIDTTFQTAGSTENLPAGSATLLQDTFVGRFYGCAIGPLLTTDQISAVEHEMLHNMEFLI